MSQGGHFTQRGSVPINIYQGFDQSNSQRQQRSFSISESSLQNARPARIGQVPSQWRGDPNPLAGDSEPWWQKQQQQQFSQTGNNSLQANGIDNIIGRIGNALQHRSTNDAPWIPHGSQQRAPQRFDGDQFRMPRSGAATVVPDMRSFADDSAYCSQSSHKRSAPSDEMSPQIAEQFLSPRRIRNPQFSGSSPPRSVASDTKLHKRPRRSPATLLRCPRAGCDKSDLKNPSDLQKHINQHDKPFRCEEPGCDRVDGFGTNNDLERHRSSRHGVQPRCGTTVGFICAACEQNNPTQKWWPRKDNFRSHGKRRHPDWDLDVLVEMSERTSRPADAATEIRSATSHHGNDEDQFQHDFSWNHVNPYQAGFQLSPTCNEGDMLAGGGQWAANEGPGRQSVPTHMSAPAIVHSNHHDEPMDDADAVFDIKSTGSALRALDFSTPHLRLTDPVRETHSGQLDTLGWQKPDPTSKSLADVSQSASQSQSVFECPDCKKVKKRACDLRKHQKRHTRPYGCTFPRCFKRFGSRNDWKRHENAQHRLREQWRCELPNNDGTACAKLCDKREDMSAHLDSRHGNEGYHHDSPLHHGAIEASHLGHEGHHNFWCGFCNTLIPQPESVHQGNPDPRFQHIGDHFDKGKLTIDDWVDIEENKMKRFIPQPKSRRDATQDSSADESDLGDDGIPGPAAYVHGYTVPFSGSAGYSTDLPVRRFTPNRRLDLDEDAEGESDHDFS